MELRVQSLFLGVLLTRRRCVSWATELWRWTCGVRKEAIFDMTLRYSRSQPVDDLYEFLQTIL
jgi:hypothetical protein